MQKKKRKKDKKRKEKSGHLFARRVQDIRLLGWLKAQEPMGDGQPPLLFTPGTLLRTKFPSPKVREMARQRTSTSPTLPQIGVMVRELSDQQCFNRACLAKMGPFCWGTVSAVKMAFTLF